MAKSIKPQDLGDAIERELTIYGEGVTEAVGNAAHDAVKKLVRLTRATAPVGHRGVYKSKISQMALEKTKLRRRYVWFVRAPAYRLTHLLVHGHATKDGGRTKGNAFLHKALDEVIPEYERKVEEAIQNGK